MPNVFKISGFLTIAAAGAIAMLSVSSAQVTGTTRTPIVQCQNPAKRVFEVPLTSSPEPRQIPCETSVWLEISSLRKTLEPLGVKFEEWVQGTNKGYRLSFPDGSIASWQQETELDYGQGGTDPVISYLPGFVSVNTFVDALRQVNVPFTMSGWDNPTLRIGQVVFGVGSKDALIQGQDWYRTALIVPLVKKLQVSTLAPMFFDSPNYIENAAKLVQFPIFYRQYKYQIRTELPNQQIVVVVERTATREISFNNKIQVMPSSTRTFITTVRQDGTIEFPSDAKNIRFVDNLKDIQSSESNGTGAIAVLKFTNQMNLGSETFTAVPSSKLSK